MYKVNALPLILLQRCKPEKRDCQWLPIKASVTGRIRVLNALKSGGKGVVSTR